MGKLRLSGSGQGDAARVIDDVIEKVRLYIYDSLGADVVAALVAITYVENPTTADGIKRSKANQTEVLLCRYHLMRTLPTLFMDASGGAGQAWNEEGLTREAGSTLKYEKELERLWGEICKNMEDLSGDDEVDGGNAQVACIGPSETPPLPGSSIGLTRRIFPGQGTGVVG